MGINKNITEHIQINWIHSGSINFIIWAHQFYYTWAQHCCQSWCIFRCPIYKNKWFLLLIKCRSYLDHFKRSVSIAELNWLKPLTTSVQCELGFHYWSPKGFSWPLKIISILQQYMSSKTTSIPLQQNRSVWWLE